MAAVEEPRDAGEWGPTTAIGPNIGHALPPSQFGSGAGVAGYGLILAGNLVIAERLREVCGTSSPSANTRVSGHLQVLAEQEGKRQARSDS